MIVLAASAPARFQVVPTAQGQGAPDVVWEAATLGALADSIHMRADGNVLLSQSGTPGAQYHVEATTNLSVWREVGTATANFNGTYEFLDTNCHSSSLKFYRFWKSQ